MTLRASDLRATATRLFAESEKRGELSSGTGVAISIVKNGVVLYEDAFGLRNRKLAQPVTTQTRFSISSLTKSFTARAFLVAQEQGKVALCDPLPPGSLVLKDRAVTSRLSFEDLLSHRCGLPAHDMLWYLTPFSTRELVEKLRYLEPLPQAFRKTFVYSNLLYAAAAHLFAEKVGLSFEHFVSEELLAPLGMSGSGFLATSPRQSKECALPYCGESEMPFKNVASISGAAAMYANAEDMSRWLLCLLSDAGNGIFAEMQKGHVAIETPDPLLSQGLEWLQQGRTHYGLGLFIGEVEGQKALYHPALIDGFSSALVAVPDRGIGFSVLTNANMSSLPGRLIEELYAQIEGLKKTTPRATSQASAPQAPPPPSQGRPDFDLSGEFENKAYGKIELSGDHNAPSLNYFDRNWPLEFSSAREASFTLTAFGLSVPLGVRFEAQAGRATQIAIPLALDPRAGLELFKRV